MRYQDRQGWEPGSDDFERERNEGYRRGSSRSPSRGEFEGPDYYGPGYSGQRAGRREFGGPDYYRPNFGTGGIAARGRYSGKGPKGYQRSDERIEEEVNEVLTRAGELDASEIEVKVQNCVVTLTGRVESRRAKRDAEDLAEDVLGVKDVENRLRVASGSESQETQVASEGKTRGRSTVRV
ncbi:MAG TPA: BON domain-containing protein [Gemmatimonadales bacterium]|jgi:hypothetical protein|nr:BON domain-containing protein [Gemmatimonadales bacterium]